jgi:hypothetical protein
MKVNKIQAFQDHNEGLHYDEKDAIEANIDICIEGIEHNCENSESSLNRDIKVWAYNNPAQLRYILNNIQKIDL